MKYRLKSVFNADEAAPEIKDLRYRGIMSYRGLRLYALILMTLSQCSTIYLFTASVNSFYGVKMVSEETISFLSVLIKLGHSSFPLLVISSIGIILNKQESFRKMLVNYFIMAVVVYLGTVFILMHIIRSSIMNIKDELSTLGTALSTLDTGEFIKSCLSNTIRVILPGNGTVDTDALNRLLSAFGIKYTLPEIEAMLALIPDAVIPHEVLTEITASLAYTSPEILADKLYYLGESLIAYAPEQLLTIFNEIFVPNAIAYFTSRMNIDIYWNLFIYALFYYFITYTPKKLSPGKLMLFRCCALFPAVWLLISFVISTRLHLLSGFTLPVWFVALLTNAQPSVLVIFFLIILFQKYQALEHAPSEKHKLGWEMFRKTRLSSLQYSVFTAVIIIVVSIIDYLLDLIPFVSGWGFGKSTYIWTCIPVLLLYSYNKKPRHKILNGIIPLYYIAHYIILFFSAIFLVSYMLIVISGQNV